MIIFPEGNQADRWQLRDLKKGYARIGFGTLKRAEKDFPLYMIPTGINYYNFTDYRGELVIEYGEAIDLQKYKALVETNEPKAINDLRAELSVAMSKLMFDIRDNAFYDQIKAVSHLLSSMNEELNVDFNRRKSFFKACGDDLTQTVLHEPVMGINVLLEEKNVSATDLRYARNGRLSVFLKPIFHLLAFVTKLINAPIMSPLENFITTKVKDHHFHASLRFVICNFLFPVYYGLILAILVLIFGWGVASTSVLGLAMLSYLGILIKDKLKYNQKLNEITGKVIDFESFDAKIKIEIDKILSQI
jgi:uncharacterized membrane protein